MIYKDRIDAANRLGERLIKYKNSDCLILAIPRGGVPIGYELSHILHAPLDIIISKKIPYPDYEEFAIGSVCDGEVVLDPNSSVLVSKEYIQKQIIRLKGQSEIKYNLFRKNKKPISIKNKTVILVDDGVATGNTVLACVRYINKQNPNKIILAVPVASMSAQHLLESEVDEFICPLIPPKFNAVGQFYRNFQQIDDQEVVWLLEKAKADLKISS